MQNLYPIKFSINSIPNNVSIIEDLFETMIYYEYCLHESDNLSCMLSAENEYIEDSLLYRLKYQKQEAGISYEKASALFMIAQRYEPCGTHLDVDSDDYVFYHILNKYGEHIFVKSYKGRGSLMIVLTDDGLKLERLDKNSDVEEIVYYALYNKEPFYTRVYVLDNTYNTDTPQLQIRGMKSDVLF